MLSKLAKFLLQLHVFQTPGDHSPQNACTTVSLRQELIHVNMQPILPVQQQREYYLS